MKPRANLAPRLAFGLCGLGGLAWLGHRARAIGAAAHARLVLERRQSARTPQSIRITTSAADRWPPTSRRATPTSSDTQGLARSLQIDGVVSALEFPRGGLVDATCMENGIVAKSQWETVGYGAWSLDASARTGGSGLGPSEQGQGGVLTLRQRGMPFDGDWQADNALGDLNTPDISLARLQPRFYLPTSPMQGSPRNGAGPSGLQIVAGGGVPGLYDGIEVPNFRTLDGSTATAGAQWSPGIALDGGRTAHRGSRREPRASVR